MGGQHALDPIFHPRSIALVGVPRKVEGPGGAGFLLALLDQGYPDHKPLYLVNPNADEIAGLKCYPSLLDCPDPVDHVISLVPSRLAGDLVEQAVQKGIRSLHFYTAGFAESGRADLAELEQQLVGRAREAGIRVLGPNCMGLYVPSERIAFGEGFPLEPGNILGISQSGGNASDMILGLAARGARFSKVISFGNGRDIAAAELFEYAAEDPDSTIVCAYLEGVPDGPALFRALKKCALNKPTIVLKGGLSTAGARAVRSHTASLAGSTEIFDAMCRQAGAIRVETMEELHDLTVAVSTEVRRITAPQAILVGGGGGFSVLSTDEIARHGIDLPELPEATQDQLREYIPVAGNSVRNPIDASFLGDVDTTASMREVLRITAKEPVADFLFVAVDSAPSWPGRGERRRRVTGAEAPDPERDERRAQQEREAIEEVAAYQAEYGRPFVAVRRDRSYTDPVGASLLEYGLQHGLGIFPSVPRAARAVGLLLRWREARAGLPAIF